MSGDPLVWTSSAAIDWHMVAEAIPHIAWVARPDGHIEFINSRCSAYTGLAPEAHYDWRWLSLVHPDDVDRATAGWREAVKTQKTFALEYRLRGGDGAFRWHACRAQPTRDAVGDVVKWIGTATDIDDYIQGESMRSAVMSQVADGVYTLDSGNRLTYMNRAASRMIGWTEDELSGKKLHDVAHASPDGTSLRGVGCAMRTEGTEGRLVRAHREVFKRKDGSTFPVAYSAIPLRMGDEVDGLAIVFREVLAPGASPKLIRVLIADSHANTSEAFQAVLNQYEGVEVVGAATTSAAAVAAVHALAPDVVLVDYGLPDRDGIDTARVITAETPDASVILMTDRHNEVLAAAGIAAGCAGVLDKGRAWVELVSAVRAAYHGEVTISQAELHSVVSKLGSSGHGRAADLTDREREVLACMRDGLSNAQAAQRLGVTTNTVRNHVQRILYKLGVHSKLEAVVVANLS